MKTLIYFPGTMDGPFFQNEIKHLSKYFGQVHIITYAGSDELFSRLSREYGFTFHAVPRMPVSWHVLNNWLAWFGCESVKKERSFIRESGTHRLRKFAYMVYYGMFRLYVEPILQKILQESEEVYLYSYWLSRPAYAIAWENPERDPKIKAIVSRAHGFDVYLERNEAGYLPFREFIDENLDEIYFVSKEGLSYFRRTWPGLTHANKLVNYLGSQKPAAMRKKILPKRVPVIVSCALIRPVKRLDLIIQTLSRLSRPYHWVHLGEGPDFEKTIRLAQDLISSGTAEFLGDVPNEAVLTKYLEMDADFLINLSDSEGLPVSFMEAASLGIPVITRPVGGCAELVSSRNGLLLESEEDPSVWARQIDQLLKERIEDLTTYRLRSDQALKTWESRFDADKSSELFFSHLKSLKRPE